MISRVNPDDDAAGPSRLAVAPSYGSVVPSNILDPRMLAQPQQIGSVNVKNSKEVTFGTKILNITVDNREKVTESVYLNQLCTRGGRYSLGSFKRSVKVDLTWSALPPCKFECLSGFVGCLVSLKGKFTFIDSFKYCGLGQLLGLEFVSKTNRSRTIRCSCAVAACFILIVAFSVLIFIVHTTLRDYTRRIDLGINDTWYLRRDDWQAVDPKAIEFLKTPVSYAVLGHTVTPKCEERMRCIKKVRAIQKDHIFNRRYDDIGFNFLVGCDGLIFEGRGSNVQGAFLSNWNSKIISIGFLGDYRRGRDEPEDVQIEHVEVLLKRLVELQLLIPDYMLMGKCQITGDTSPGALLNARLKDFSHWHSANFSKCPPN